MTVSYFEWKQNLSGESWTKQRVFRELKDVLAGAFDSMWRMHETKQVDLRTAAYLLAVDRVARAAL